VVTLRLVSTIVLCGCTPEKIILSAFEGKGKRNNHTLFDVMHCIEAGIKHAIVSHPRVPPLDICVFLQINDY
jgi:hypothetical protein